MRSSSFNEDGCINSGAGLYKTLINISLENLLEAILEVKNDASFKEEHKISIIVQKYIIASVSGIAFSIDPVNFNDDNIVIEYYKGECDVLTSGRITPEVIYIDKKNTEHNNNLLPKDIGNIILRLEWFFGCPVDVEWCTDKEGKLWILQSRQITVIPQYCYHYQWSTNEYLWSIEKAFIVRAGLNEKNLNIPYELKEILYSRKELEDFYYYIGLKDKINLSSYLRNQLKDDDFNHHEIYMDINKNFNQIEKQTILERLNSLFYLYEKCIAAYAISGQLVTNILERQTLSFFSERELLYLMHSEIEDLMIQEQKDFLKIGENEEELLEHARKYPYLALGYFDKISFISHLIALKKSSKKITIEESKKSLDKGLDFKEIDERFQNCPENVKKSIERLRFLSLDRMKIKNGWGGVHFFMLDIIDYMNKATGESKSDIYYYYLCEDIMRLITDGIKLTESEKNLRKKGVVMKTEEIDGAVKSSIKFGEFFEEKSHTKIMKNFILAGRAAIKKEVTGFVKIIEGSRPVFDDIRSNTIIVTSMSQPNIIPFIIKAIGLITNEGGILSHAAILAREYNKACIVGTRNATRILKDGDKVTMWPDGKITLEK